MMGARLPVVDLLCYVVLLSVVAVFPATSKSYEWRDSSELLNATLVKKAVAGGIDNSVEDRKTFALLVGKTAGLVSQPCRISYDKYDTNNIVCKYAHLDGKLGVQTIDDGFKYLALTGTTDKFSWVKYYNFKILRDTAVPTDVLTDVVGRAKIDGMNKIIGKVNLVTKLFTTNYNKALVVKRDYEVLVWDKECPQE